MAVNPLSHPDQEANVRGQPVSNFTPTPSTSMTKNSEGYNSDFRTSRPLAPLHIDLQMSKKDITLHTTYL